MNPEQSHARAFQGISEVTFPLHPRVHSEEQVSHLVRELLARIEAEGPGLDHTDVLQALAITTALRLAVAEANQKPGIELAIEPIDMATDSLTRASLEPEPANSPGVR
jgi:hypothetical protein